MSSRSKNWNKKPGVPGWEYGPNKDTRVRLRARHKAVKARQRNRDRQFGL